MLVPLLQVHQQQTATPMQDLRAEKFPASPLWGSWSHLNTNHTSPHFTANAGRIDAISPTI